MAVRLCTTYASSPLEAFIEEGDGMALSSQDIDAIVAGRTVQSLFRVMVARRPDAVAVRWPKLADDPHPPDEPFGVAEFFRDAFAAATSVAARLARV